MHRTCLHTHHPPKYLQVQALYFSLSLIHTDGWIYDP